MRVEIREHVPGLLNGAPFPNVGDKVDLPDGLALSLINDGRAAAVAQAPAETRETATAPAAEKRGPGRPRKGA